MKIGIIGPGFLGSRLKRHFEKDHEVFIFSRTTPLENIKTCEIIIISVAPKNRNEYESCYVETCNKVISLIDNSKYIVYISSTSVYGPQGGSLVTEETICKPKNIYQKLLLDAEESILRNKDTLVLRLGEIYGYEREIALRVINTPVFASDGCNTTNIIHVDDIVAFIDFSIKNQLKGLFNLVSDTHITRKELYSNIKKALNLQPPVFDPSKEVMHSDNKTVDNSKIKRFGYVFKHLNYQIPLQVAFSPCPNDTFLFYALTRGFINSKLEILPILKDVQTLNEEAIHGLYPVTKLSFYALSQLDEYTYLPVGCALGYGCGPKLVGRKPYHLKDIKNLKIAVPGKNTTAYLLSKIFLDKPSEVVFCRYDEVFELLNKGLVDLALIIHEQRFSFKKAGFYEILDLGTIWEEKTNLPLPLGCIAVKRSLPASLIRELTFALEESLQFAFSQPREAMSFILENAIEKDESIVKDHIKLYVNQETLKLSDKGKKAIELLMDYSKKI
jgi:1,4-dihydroxy-6-naphthoate synthase